MHLPESKLRPFCRQNDELFISKSRYFSSKYRKQLEKSYRKAKKFAYKNLDVDQHHNSFHRIFNLFHLSSHHSDVKRANN